MYSISHKHRNKWDLLYCIKLGQFLWVFLNLYISFNLLIGWLIQSGPLNSRKYAQKCSRFSQYFYLSTLIPKHVSKSWSLPWVINHTNTFLKWFNPTSSILLLPLELSVHLLSGAILYISRYKIFLHHFKLQVKLFCFITAFLCTYKNKYNLEYITVFCDYISIWNIFAVHSLFFSA